MLTREQDASVPLRFESPRAQLDIVKDCSDLQGQFPSNVELLFIFWEHDSATNPNAEADLIAVEKLAPHLLKSDLIGCEIASQSISPDKSEVHAAYDYLNHILKTPSPILSLRSQSEVIVTNSMLEAIAITNKARTLGRENPPQFFAFDALNYVETHDDQGGAKKQTSMDWITSNASDMRHREGISIRQLFTKANELTKDGQQHQIAVLYGANHSLISVATQQLGAPTRRVFVEKPLIPLVEAVLRKSRFHDDTLSKPEVRQLEKLEDRAMTIGYLSVKKAITSRTAMLERSIDNNTLNTYESLARLCLRADQNMLSSSAQQRFDTAFNVVSSRLKRTLHSNDTVEQSLETLLQMAKQEADYSIR